ncbi:hypothetical protein [Aeoliella sp.]|uniref:hypothetical protein n=1 Tax=Aeoliella sp. TaxID=2795800 RepID=UPI003CCBED3C
MSSASPQVVDYLTKQLARNPINESGDIVRSRAKAFRLEAKQKTKSANAPSAGERQKVRDQLEQIRQACFTGPVDQLLGRIRQLPVQEFPELAALARRLTVVLQSRGKLPALASDRRFDGDFFSVLKKILVSPSRDVAVLREQVLASFRHRHNRRHGQAMIRLLKTELPELYALESDWLDSLLRYSARKHAVAAAPGQAATTERSSNGWPWWLFLLVLPVIRGCAHIANESSSSSKSRSSYTEPVYTPPRVEIPDTFEDTYRPGRQTQPEQFRTGPPDREVWEVEDPFKEHRKSIEDARARMDKILEEHRSNRQRYTPPEYPRPPNVPTPSPPGSNRSRPNFPRPYSTSPGLPGP